VKCDNLTGYAEEDRPMKRKSRTTRRSNLPAADIYDAFPRSGLVRHYAAFIRSQMVFRLTEAVVNGPSRIATVRTMMGRG
jgi:hypothetical protein